jgi:sugar phosphate isomerase/epimerase
MAETNLCETLSELAEYGLSKGVKVALENSPYKNDTYRLVYHPQSHTKILNQVDHPNLGALLDFAHAFLYKFDLIDYLEKIQPYLIEIHAHNNFGADDDHLGLPNGLIDYEPIVKHPGVRNIPFIMEIISYEEVMKTLEWLKEII